MRRAEPRGQEWSPTYMKYWGWFVIKLIAAAAVLLTLDYAVHALFPRRAPLIYSHLQPFAHDLGYTTIMMVLLALIAVLLAPPYYENWRLQRYLTALAHGPASTHRSTDLLRALVIDKAASMGLPVRTGDVQVTAGPTSVKIEVLYVVHIGP